MTVEWEVDGKQSANSLRAMKEALNERKSINVVPCISNVCIY